MYFSARESRRNRSSSLESRGEKISSGLMFLKCRDCSVPLGSHTSRYLDRTGEKRKYRERKNYRKGVSLLWRLQCIRNNENTFQSKLDPYVKRAHFNATWVSSQIFRKTPSYFGHIREAKPICPITWRNHTVRFLDKSSVGQQDKNCFSQLSVDLLKVLMDAYCK